MEQIIRALQLIAETLARMEHKVDALLKHSHVPTEPMHFSYQFCPVCRNSREFIVDLAAGIVIGKCGCSTGKQPPLMPLVPVTQPLPTGGRDASASIPSDPEAGTPNRP